MTVYEKVQEFLTDRYKNSSVPSNRKQFDIELYDIVYEIENLYGNSFERWLKSFNDHQKELKSLGEV